MKVQHHTATGIGLLVIHLVALAAFLPQFFSWSALIVAVVLYNFTGFGVTLAYHRILTHKGLRLAKPLEYLATTFGALALQGGPIEWVSTHRKHHAFSDDEGDPHSMGRRGFLWAHVEWLFRKNEQMLSAEEVKRYVPDLLADPYYRWLEGNTLWLQIALGMVLFAVGGASWVIWGIFVRLVVCYHVTWMINSVSHMAGYRSFKTTDLSTNCWWLALLSWGEGWHNNHHAFPFSARHGLRWFEVDFTWLLVRALRVARLAHEIKVPTKEMRERLLAGGRAIKRGTGTQTPART